MLIEKYYVSLLATCATSQNRRQKIFNRGDLRFCGGLWVYAGVLDILKMEKNQLYL